MFSTHDRDRVVARLIEAAQADKRVRAAALVGSLSRPDVDRWADADLAFGVDDVTHVRDVLADFGAILSSEFGAVQLFDLPAGSALFRVFLLNGCLQCDLSAMTATDFGALGPKFKLLFGQAATKPFVEPPSASDLFGYAVHHAVRARFCIERGRFWQAEYWMSGVRDYALALACRSRNLPARDGRGFDELPAEVSAPFRGALVSALDREDLLRGLAVAIDGLLKESNGVVDRTADVESRLRELVADWGA
jgi:Streptomycin adenylyltransferase